MIKKLSVILAIALILGCFSGCKEEPERDVSDFAMYSDNYEVSEGMVKYYFNLQYKSFVNVYSDNLENIGLDTSLPLSEQECNVDSSKASWYDYFMDSAKEKFSQLLAVREQAKADSVELSSKDRQRIEENFSLIKEAAENLDLSLEEYLGENFGDGVSEEDARAYLELEQFGSKYYDKYISSLDKTDGRLEEYFDGHKKIYCTVDYLRFETTPVGDDIMAMTNARSAADYIAEAKSVEEFEDRVYSYVVNYYVDNYADKYSDKEIAKKAKEAASDCYVKNAAYQSSDTALRWAFDSEREAGDSTVEQDDENRKCYVYYLAVPMQKETYETPNIRHILFGLDDNVTFADAKVKADEVLSNLSSAGFSEESFKTAAKQYSADTITKNSGGKYEEVLKNSFAYSEIDEWLFADDRKAGDSTLIKTDSGWHLFYIESYGREAWKVQAETGLCNNEFSKYLSDLCDEYVVHINSNVIYRIEEANFNTEADGEETA